MASKPTERCVVALLLCLVYMPCPALAADDEKYQKKVDALIDQLNDPDNAERRTTGRDVRELNVEALPALQAALKRDDLSWVAIVAIRKGIEEIERRRDKQTHAARCAKRLAWYRKHMVEAYKEFGHRDPKWDKKAIEGIDRLARALAKDPTYDSNVGYGIVGLLDSAINAGCTDPMVNWCLVNRYQWIRAGGNEFHRKFYDRAVAGFEKRPYHPYFRAHAIAFAGTTRLDAKKKLTDPAARKWQEKMNPIMKELLAAIAADKSIEPKLLQNSAFNLVTCYKRISGDRVEAMKTLQPLLEKHLTKAMLHAARGNDLVSAAWDARGYGWASSVTQAQWKLFNERLTTAVTELQSSIKADPTNHLPYTKLLRVSFGLNVNRPVMEKIFTAAMSLNPDNYDACEDKMNYLQPRWHGSVEELLQFGRQCLLTGNYDAGLPFILVHIHQTLSYRNVQGQLMNKQDPNYYARPGVWEDIVAVCEGKLKRHPKDRLTHAYYGRAAVSAGRWAIAHRELQAAGNWPDYRAFSMNKQQWDALRADVAQKAKAASGR